MWRSANSLLSTIFGTLLAISIERYPFWGRTAISTLIYLPIVMPDLTLRPLRLCGSKHQCLSTIKCGNDLGLLYICSF